MKQIVVYECNIIKMADVAEFSRGDQLLEDAALIDHLQGGVITR